LAVVIGAGAGAGAEAAAGVLVGGAAGAEAGAAWADTLHWSNTKTAEAQRGLVIIVNILVISRNLCIDEALSKRGCAVGKGFESADEYFKIRKNCIFTLM